MELNVNVKRIGPVGAESPSHNCRSDNAAEMVALMDVIEDLRQQNRELHDRLLAVYAPTVAQTLPAMPSFQVDYRGPVGVENPSHNTPPVTQPVELPGTQVEGGE